MFTREELTAAWDRVRHGGTAAGVDGLAPAAIEGDIETQLDALVTDVTSAAYSPQAYRAVDVRKPDGGIRRLTIPTVRDRIVHTAAAMKLVEFIEPSLGTASFAYRPGLGVHDALEAVVRARDGGLRIGLRADIARFFDSVPHVPLIEMLREHHIPEPLIDLIWASLRAPVVAPEGLVRPTMGLPQGLATAPALANIYLIPFDRAFLEQPYTLVRYADDMLVLCHNPSQLGHVAGTVITALERLELRLAEEKSEFVSFEDGFDFLGARFHGKTVLPAAPHPYEPTFTIPPSEPRPIPRAAQALPHNILRTLYIQENGASLRCRQERFQVLRKGDILLDIPVEHVDQIFTFGQVHLSSYAVALCLRREIPVHFFSSYGRYFGILHPVNDASPGVLRAQLALTDDPAVRLRFAKSVVSAKLAGERALLSRQARNHSELDLQKHLESLKQATARLDAASTLDQIRGIEGSAAATYFEGFGICLARSAPFHGRHRRPPTDPVNSLLSFGYALIFYNTYSYLRARRLEPTLGLLHEPRDGHPALASDLVEEFRAPLVDALVLRLFNRHEFSLVDFVYGEGSPRPCHMTDDARVRFLNAFEDRMSQQVEHPDLSFPVNWRRILDLQALRFRRWIDGAVNAYHPYHEELP